MSRVRATYRGHIARGIVEEVVPWFEETWDYTDTADMLAQDHTSSTQYFTGGEVKLITGLTDTPWGGSKAYERHYYGLGDDRTVRLRLHPTIYRGDQGAVQDENFNREIWVEIYVKWDSNWQLHDPPEGGDDKTIFFVPTPRYYPGNHRNRWQTKIANFGTDIASSASNNYWGAQNRPELWDPPAQYVWDWLYDDEWHLLRWHLRMSSEVGVADGRYLLHIDGIDFHDFDNIDTGSPADDFFNVISLGNNGTVKAEASMYYGRVRVYTSDPGWAAGITPVRI